MARNPNLDTAPKFETPEFDLRILKAYPDKGRKVFRIQRKLRSVGSKWETLRLEALEKINKGFQEKRTPYSVAFNKVKKILIELYRERDRHKPRPVYHSENLRILEEYWESVYPKKRRRKMEAPEAAWGDLRRAVEAAENLPLDSCSEDELQDLIDENYEHLPDKHRRLCTWTNMILRWLDRPFVIEKVGAPKKIIKYLTREEFVRVEQYLTYKKSDVFQILCNVAWYTGLRKGEIFAIEEKDLQKDLFLYVDLQVDKDLKLKETKTKIRRKAFIIKGGAEWIRKWLLVPQEVKDQLRSYNHAEKVRNACAKVFPDPEKECTFHCLRHSYAVKLLSRGVPMAHLAQSLGNSNDVCERYYTGFVLTDESLELMQMLMERESDSKIV